MLEERPNKHPLWQTMTELLAEDMCSNANMNAGKCNAVNIRTSDKLLNMCACFATATYAMRDARSHLLRARPTAAAAAPVVC